MNKLTIARRLAEMKNITLVQARKVVDVFFDSIYEALKNHNRIEIRGWGVFGIKPLKEKIRRNPKTNEKIILGDRYRVFFKPSEILLKMIN